MNSRPIAHHITFGTYGTRLPGDPRGTVDRAVRKWLKRWLGEALSSEWKRPDGATWWAEGGTVKWVWTDDYCGRVGYVDGQRASGPVGPRTGQ